MNKILKSGLLIALLSIFATGCQEVKPYDYTALKKSKPRSIVVIPPRNSSIEVNAPYVYLSTLTEPLAEKGYYVLPVAVVDQFLKENGLPTPAEMNGISLEKIREHMGADAVLYVEIKEFGQKYLILSSVATVMAELKLVDTRTGELLWRATAHAQMDSSNNNNSGGPVGILVYLISAAITQVTDDRTPEASRLANHLAINAEKIGLLNGPYKVPVK
ncbi:putative lipoprotein [Bathymodiolus thermophilus thioautotrophic gill symbiont]|jgi:hypothetical protein|uniref:Lipoprotein n=1 Tax=Bathymodiolus thermophilus thioautotrophic gill symbiont TaxID=2360 RepID=A0A1J5TZ74_9GAMM|nr:GNA1162 family protein [Bathymodiolus thermophilus thioautotrophic gill symbiont]AYQ55999.1 Lipoprotein [Bathymodiolus thermophilus thioautotrophic gill symbiont]OIR25516.1 hypothetical protein BGC33_06900 [Bathymodiolus thermophilus thioautotrophic gill symbiont]CAB5499190.1 putative lipoprotein [Bathymodiolus thermophilus thioautotrophic gill symbiont]CAB5501198.1 putative lipoprotein [Bathymodiolus thermophilus thioautotrophic gill symbiont]